MPKQSAPSGPVAPPSLNSHAGRTAGSQRWIRPALYAAGVALLAWMIWISRTQLAVLKTSIDAAWFAASLPLGVFMTICYGGIFGLTLRKHGALAEVSEATLIYLESQPGKYVPGRIGSIAMQAILVKSRNPWIITTLANIELLAICLLHMLLIGMAALFYRSPWAILLLVAGLGVGLALIHYDWLKYLAKLLRMSPSTYASIHGNASKSALSGGAALQLFAIALAAASTCVLLKSSGLVADSALVKIAGVLYIGWAVGTLALPVPAGLGVREAATMLVGNLVSIPISTEQLVALAVLSRAWQLCVDVLCLLLAALIRATRKAPG